MKVLAGDWPENSNVAIKRSITGKIQSMMIQKGVFSFDYVKLEDIRSCLQQLHADPFQPDDLA